MSRSQQANEFIMWQDRRITRRRVFRRSTASVGSAANSKLWPLDGGALAARIREPRLPVDADVGAAVGVFDGADGGVGAGIRRAVGKLQGRGTGGPRDVEGGGRGGGAYPNRTASGQHQLAGKVGSIELQADTVGSASCEIPIDVVAG